MAELKAILHDAQSSRKKTSQIVKQARTHFMLRAYVAGARWTL